jgi:hypothetical protein
MDADTVETVDGQDVNDWIEANNINPADFRTINSYCELYNIPMDSIEYVSGTGRDSFIIDGHTLTVYGWDEVMDELCEIVTEKVDSLIGSSFIWDFFGDEMVDDIADMRCDRIEGDTAVMLAETWLDLRYTDEDFIKDETNKNSRIKLSRQ